RYQSRTVAEKLGIEADSTVALFDAPRDCAAVLGTLPEGVELADDPDEVHPLTLWFASDPEAYQAALPRMRAIAARTRLWVFWRKGSKNGITQFLIRRLANEFGLVDYKICAARAGRCAMAFAPR